MLFLFLSFLSSCQKGLESSQSQKLNLRDVLGGGNVEGFLRADQPRDFNFPQDHIEHKGFRNEWWYITGNLTTAEGRRFGYQVTFFTTATGMSSAQESAWAGEKVWMAHAALTDLENTQHIAIERFTRENPGLAGAVLNPFKVWLENWRLESTDNNFPWRLTIEDPAFSLQLSLVSAKNLVLQGHEGLSQKSPESGNASYYYSFTRLPTVGEITIGDELFQVSGESWLDREWSTSALGADQTGWDWFSLQFNDGQELMYYQLRDESGNSHASSEGNWTDTLGQQHLIHNNDIDLKEMKSWQSPSGVIYTTEWLMSYQGQDWIIRAILDDQLMDVSFLYWEGAIDVLLADSGEKVGQGFLEMVRE